MSDGVKNRKQSRRDVPLLVQYQFDVTDAFHTEYAANVSRGGMFIHSPSPPANGSLVHLQFILKGGVRVIRVTARVVWTREPARGQPVTEEHGCGVMFVDMTPEDLAAVTSLAEDT